MNILASGHYLGRVTNSRTLIVSFHAVPVTTYIRVNGSWLLYLSHQFISLAEPNGLKYQSSGHTPIVEVLRRFPHVRMPSQHPKLFGQRCL